MITMSSSFGAMSMKKNEQKGKVFFATLDFFMSTINTTFIFTQLIIIETKITPIAAK